MDRRKEYDKRVLETMCRDYCRSVHGHAQLCGECAELLAYSCESIDKCPLGRKKTTCRKCTIHCFAPERKHEIRDVMRFSGKRLIRQHPIMALRYLFMVLFS